MSRRRLLSLAAVGIASVVAAGCAIAVAGGDKHRLRKMLDQAAPSPRQTVGCSYASGAFGGETPSLSCVYFVRGDVAGVARAAARRLHAHRFTVACRRDGDRIEISGSDGTTRVRGYTAAGAVTFDADGTPLDVYPVNIAPTPRKPVPSGSVALKLGLDKHKVASPRDDLMPFARRCPEIT